MTDNTINRATKIALMWLSNEPTAYNKWQACRNPIQVEALINGLLEERGEVSLFDDLSLGSHDPDIVAEATKLIDYAYLYHCLKEMSDGA